MKKRDQLLDDRDELDGLLKEAEDGYASGVVYRLRQKQETTRAELGTLEDAKRYYAARLHGERIPPRRKRKPAERGGAFPGLIGHLGLRE